ncbi:MAG TPA: 50S ribosomal protein L30 [Armatimonadota bacterium]|nr:50S ribosomal protein L30 [Armatimonadota bacterium]
MSRLRITLRRSLIGHPKSQKDTARALGLGRVGRTVVRSDTPAIRGMVNTVSHLVTLEQLDEDEDKRGI